MKTKMIMMTCLLFLLYACQVEEKGQYPIDNIPPSKVTSAKVQENFAGGAIIVYDIPEDEDIHYVRVRYTLDNGKLIEKKISGYSNRVTIEGIGRSREVPVELTVVDRSRNESESVIVVAYPQNSPIYDIANSMVTKDDYGGIRISWENPTELFITIDVYSLDNDSDILQVERFYSKMRIGIANVRGQEAKETFFSITIRDNWENSVDIAGKQYTPWEEEKLDKSKFRKWSPPGLPLVLQEGKFENLFDDKWWGTGNTILAVTVPYFTLDLGQVVKLSRFKIYNRGEPAISFTTHQPKRFELWGSITPNVTDDIFDWQYIGQWEAIKPSGLPLGQITNEDIEYSAVQGENFDVEDSPSIRYIWFRSIETWGKSNGIQICEMTFWGQLQE